MMATRLAFVFALSWIAVVIPWPALVAEALMTGVGMEGWRIVRVTP